MMGARLWHIVVLSVLALAFVGCDETVSHPEDLEQVLRTHTGSSQAPAVEVDGRAEGAEAFAAFWAERPDLSREDAVDAFVEQEVVFGGAIERGLAADREVAVARKRAMVRRLLALTVEKDVSRESLEADEIDQMVQVVADEVGHPQGLRASHILAAVPRKKQLEKKAPGVDRDAVYDQARALIDEIRDELPEQPTAYDLVEARREFDQKVEAPVSVEVNAHLHFPIKEAPGEALPEHWIGVVEEFRKPAVEAARRGDFGELGEPVRSPFGWHLIVVHEVLPGAKADPDAVREVAIARLLEKKRAAKVSEYYKEWSKRADIRTYPNVIEESEELQ